MTIILPEWFLNLISIMMSITVVLNISTFFWRMKVTKVDKENLLSVIGVMETILPFINEPRIHVLMVDMIKMYRGAYGRGII